MEIILQIVQQRKTLVALIGGGVLGLLLGLLIGWELWPVQWTNATPKHLRSDFQSEYVLWVAEEYADTGDPEWARTKLGAEFWEEGELIRTLEEMAGEASGQEAIRLRALAQALETTAPAEEVPPEAEPGEPSEPGGLSVRSVGAFCGVVLLVVACVAGMVYLVGRLRKPRAVSPERRPAARVARERLSAEEETQWGAEGPPLAQFTTTYKLGDDHYDPSFSIELENGEFMGECGVGISETIGVGTPNKVTAFEVWLFDKNDIRTVTKVLMSDYAFHDEALRTKLAPKGEPTLAEVGQDVILETKTLRVRGRVVEAEYGTGNLPPDSFFERLTVDLATWVTLDQDEEAVSAADGVSLTPPTL